MLSNKLDTERQILYDHLDVNLKNQNLQNQRVEQWLPGVEGWKRWGDAGQRVQALSYKINKPWGSNVSPDNYR